jgi:hypothetical protein
MRPLVIPLAEHPAASKVLCDERANPPDVGIQLTSVGTSDVLRRIPVR